MAKLHLEVVSPEKVVFEADVDSFVVRAADGDLGVRPGHAPLFTLLQEGIMRYREAGNQRTMVLMGGFLQVEANRARVLTESAELAGDIDLVRAKQSKERAEARLMEKAQLQPGERQSAVDMARAEAALRRALIRIRARELDHY